MGGRVKALVPVARADIRSDAGRALVLRRLAEHPPVVAVLVATPCETGSRAREQPMPRELLEAGFPETRSLRSEAGPWGLQSTRDEGAAAERAQLESANALRAFMVKLVRRTSLLGILWVLGNPWCSLP